MDTDDVFLGVKAHSVTPIEGIITSISLDTATVGDFANDPEGDRVLDITKSPTVQIETNSLLYERLPTVTIDSANGSGAELIAVGEGVGGIDKVKVVDYGARYNDPPTIDCTSIGDGNCIARAEVGVVAEYPGFWATTDGKLSSDKVLQDNLYYQAFSYVIKSDQLISSYATILKKLAHPAGLAFFGQFLKNVCIDSSIADMDGDPYSCREPIIMEYRNYEVESTISPILDPGSLDYPPQEPHPNTGNHRNIPAGMAFKDIKLRDFLWLCKSVGGCGQ